MSKSRDDSSPPASPGHVKRERSTRYPGVHLAEALKLCESIDELGLDGLTAADIASALGYKNIKTNTFSARLSAARQFGLLTLTGDGYALTPLAREILHPVDPAEQPRLYRQACSSRRSTPSWPTASAASASPRPRSWATCSTTTTRSSPRPSGRPPRRSSSRRGSPGRWATTRSSAPKGSPRTLRPPGLPRPQSPRNRRPPRSRPVTAPAPRPHANPADVRLDLRLWDRDEGKTIRVRAPQSITAASFERFLQAFRLLVRIEE